jgi:nucleoside-diphosphate-sugar epimerase
MEAGVLCHIVDLRDRDAVHRLVKEVRPTVIFNLSSHGAYPHQTDATRIFETNLLGLLHLLDACDPVDYRLFVHTGSSSEYGRKTAPMRETDELRPESVYGVSKVAQSLLCQQWSRQQGRPIVVLRLFSVYGPLEEPTRLIPRIVTAMLDHASLAMVSPRTSRDFVYVDDVVEAMLRIDRLHTLETTNGTILNLGTGVQTTLAEIVSTLESIAGAPLKAEWNTMPARPWDTETWVADTTRLRQALGWVPTVSVREGLALSVEWFRANRRFYPAQA